jgi:hypothetical protein
MNINSPSPLIPLQEMHWGRDNIRMVTIGSMVGYRGQATLLFAHVRIKEKIATYFFFVPITQGKVHITYATARGDE